MRNLIKLLLLAPILLGTFIFGVAQQQNFPGGGASSPSNLTAFFSGYIGLSPLDCGNAACTTQDLNAGNGRATQDGVMNGTTTITSATMGFCNGGSVACSSLESNGQTKTSDIGRVFEAVCSASASFSATISAVASATSITVSTSAGACNASSLQIFVGSDNTNTLQNWVANGLANHAIHSFYLPKGVYYTTKPLRFVNANATNECSGAVNPTSGFVFCGLGLIGAGGSQAIIHPATQPNFSWSTGSSITNGVILTQNFAFGLVTGIGIVGDTVPYASTGLSTIAGAFVIGPAVQHFFINGNWFNGVAVSDVTPTSRGGLIDTGCFECYISNNAVESNGVDAEVIATLAEKEVYDTNYLENAANGAPLTGSALILGGANVKQATFRNLHFKGPNNNSAGIVFQPGFTIAPGYTVEFAGGRMDQGSATDVGAWVRACTGPGTIEFNNFNFVNTNNAAGVRLLRIDNGPTTCPVVINGGVMSPGGTTSTAVLNNSTGGVWMQGVSCTNAGTPCSASQFSGTGTINQLLQQAAGWGGLAGISGIYFLSNQGTGCVIGNFAASAGWGTTAAFTAPTGFNQSCRVTITASGIGQAANPTITWTLPNALPAATTTCEMHQSGGTGAFLMMLQTTLSATAPIFTLQGTPTAAATYIYDVRCGP